MAKMIHKNVGGKMVAVGVSSCDGGDGSEVVSEAAVPAAEAPTQNAKKNYKVEVFSGKGKAKDKFFWHRVHRGKIRSTGGQGFDSEAKALKDEAFDREMVETGQPTIETPE